MAKLGVRLKSAKLADGWEVVALDELHGRQPGIERGVLAADCQVAFGEVQVDHFTGTARRRAQANTAGIGEQVEYGFACAVGLEPAACIAQVEK